MVRRKALRFSYFARRGRKKTARRIALKLFAAVFLVGLALFLATRPVFLIRDIEVSGAEAVSGSAVEEFVRSELAGAYGSLIPRGNVFFYPERRIEKSVPRQFPRIESANAGLLSLARLGVEVSERTPVALWCAFVPEYGAEKCYLMDGKGFVFEDAPASSSSIFFRIIGGSADNLVGSHVLDGERLSALLSFLRALGGLSLTPVSLTLLSGGDLEAEVAGGARILAREGKDIAKQIENLRKLLSEKDLLPVRDGQLRVDYIDLRYGNKLYFKPQ